MVTLHIVVGVALLLVSLVLMIWNIVRITQKRSGRSFSRLLSTLVDIQVLLGIIAYVLKPLSGIGILHPITMVLVLVVVHTMIKEKRPERTQLIGYILTFVLIVIGVSFVR